MNAKEESPMSPLEQHALQEILARGLRVVRFGAGFRVFGPGVDLLTLRLASLSATDLRPAPETTFFSTRGTRP